MNFFSPNYRYVKNTSGFPDSSQRKLYVTASYSQINFMLDLDNVLLEERNKTPKSGVSGDE